MRALVIDDDDMLRETIVSFLEMADIDVVDSGSADGGLRIMATEPADLVITDILMPDKEGIQTITELRQKHPKVKIIAMSGGGSVKNMSFLDLAKKRGADEALQKPFSRQQLLDTVKQLFAA